MKTEAFVKGWVEMFEAVGVCEGAQHLWHAEFEARFPERHQSFLEWLGMPEERIAEIRAKSRAAKQG